MKDYTSLKSWQKARQEHDAAREELSRHLDGLERLCENQHRNDWSPLEQHVTDLFMAQLLYKRMRLLKLEGDWPEDASGKPEITIQNVLDLVKSPSS